MYEPLSLGGRSFLISWDLPGGGGKRVGAMKKKNGFKRGKEKTLGLKDGSLKNPFKFCNSNRNKSNFSLGKSNTLSHFLFFLSLFLSFAFLFFSFLFFGGGGVLWTQGGFIIYDRNPLPPPPPPPSKNEGAISLALFQEYDEEKYSPR